MAFDYNQAGEQRSFIIPDKTVAVVQLNIRDGNAGEGGIMTRSKDGGCEMLSCEVVVVDGPHAKRKFFENMVTSGTTDGHAQAVDITNRKLRAILESARGIKPADVSEAAKKARVAEFGDFDGIRFIARIGVEPPKGGYRETNFIAMVVTPEMKEWHAVDQVAPTPKPSGSDAGGNVIIKPAWAS
jgi:hypothetical protein